MSDENGLTAGHKT